MINIHLNSIFTHYCLVAISIENVQSVNNSALPHDALVTLKILPPSSPLKLGGSRKFVVLKMWVVVLKRLGIIALAYHTAFFALNTYSRQCIPALQLRRPVIQTRSSFVSSHRPPSRSCRLQGSSDPKLRTAALEQQPRCKYCFYNEKL